MKLKLTLLALLASQYAFSQIDLPQQSSKAEVEQKIGYTKVDVEYFRPNLNKRTAIGGTLVPFGQVWRTGANENTTVEFSTDVQVEGKNLAAGTYSLYTIPNQKTWDVIFYKTTDNWGNPKNWDESQIALKTTVPSSKTDSKVESFTIFFSDVHIDNANLVLTWENTVVKVNITTPTHKMAQETIQKELNANSSARDFYNAANYYFSNNINLAKAQEWINIAIQKDGNAGFFKTLKTKIDEAIK